MSPARTSPSEDTPLPIGAVPHMQARGWSVSLPVRAEHVETEKQLVVYERVLVGRHAVKDVERFESSVRREELHVDLKD